jgi:hypothetical protein
MVGLYPALTLSNSSYSLSVEKMASAAFNTGHFRDFFFIVIVVSILGIANIIDNLVSSIRTNKKVGDLSILCFLVLILIYVYVMLYAPGHFVALAQENGVLNSDILKHDYDIIRNTLVAGIATELVIAMREPPAPAPVGLGQPSTT